ncbi:MULTISPECIES: NAD(P)H-dependent oxidoreductase [Providencia]|uniref:NAD(P)H-dependent oxidoreductase n=1 Tax=Providencia TaxID=586 RepID=UPI00197FDA6E|nr:MULTISPECIES: NAD(P)H-dependent oxidoreductase [Providencia]MBN4867035.1 NAD(P)H-dependent oxidoreductase [Providencia stuartii]MBN4876537.1 NAD(P)H-dependent oxidoreductase [Providencia stuartii]MBN4881049.1 NAD(P)H-dependent oxidoreductase [Providencia stuartii]MBN4885557.1 NAD(P)H-dependent oxidoreductase [Providencia stuartii]HEM8291612.1 NAD(P)H-dependent oxidoreductase [Providencia stuartii]
MVTIIYAHPWDGSFCHFLLETIEKELMAKNKKFQIIDLHTDNFNPVLTEAELALYAKGNFIDPLVGKYQRILKASCEVIVIFPVWWMGMPAILKGFFDKVMLNGFAWYYNEQQQKLLPLLDINKTTIVTTSEEPTDFIVKEGDPVHDAIFHCMTAVGLKNGKWMNCDRVTQGGDEHRLAFIASLLDEI